MSTPTRIYVSVPRDGWLEANQLDVKRGIFDRIRSVGFEPHEFLLSGEFSKLTWSHDNVQYILGRCQGAVILNFVRWNVWDEQKKYKFNSAYNHYEGALALAMNLPTFVLVHEHIYKAGITIKGRAKHFVRLPDKVDASWLDTDDCQSKFDEWVEAVKNRRHIFLGYGFQAQATADRIKDVLNEKGVSFMDGVSDLDPAARLTSEIDRASKSCLGGIFIFTKDHEISAGNKKPLTREEQVIFEAGYFLHAKGKDKVLIIREAGAKMPTFLGGLAVLQFQNRNDISSIENDLKKFIANHI